MLKCVEILSAVDDVRRVRFGPDALLAVQNGIRG